MSAKNQKKQLGLYLDERPGLEFERHARYSVVQTELREYLESMPSTSAFFAQKWQSQFERFKTWRRSRGYEKTVRPFDFRVAMDETGWCGSCGQLYEKCGCETDLPLTGKEMSL